MAGVTVIEWLIIVGIDAQIRIVSGVKVLGDLHHWIIRIAVMALLMMNYTILIARGHGILYERNFDGIVGARRNISIVVALVMMFLAIVFFVFSGLENRKIS